MVKAAGRLGLDLTTHRARQVTLEMMDWADTIVAMDTHVRDVLIDVCGESNQSKLALYLRDRDVPDPIGQDQEAFNECAVLISAGTALHIG
ncbi:hypothetical protein OG933_01685 [Streptomyces sp. NBC_00016]|uniref:arsenate reductase/protein-tyrosine-phosphatase family protein n=1 Tax=Streptomyces sp. NBC_00016 TaxID=2975622 RepID=UPI00324B7138